MSLFRLPFQTPFSDKHNTIRGSPRPHGLAARPLLANAEFEAAGLGRHSDLHTKARLRVGWPAGAPRAHATAEYWQVGEHALAAQFSVRNQGAAAATLASDAGLTPAHFGGHAIWVPVPVGKQSPGQPQDG